MFKLSPDFKLPREFVTWKAAVIGRTGSGKTNTGVVIAEQMIEQGFPLVIIEPQGDWWGLRSKYKIAILGGEHGDIPLEPSAGELAADFVINERVPVLLDLFSMGEGEMVRFATAFAQRLWAKNRDALHVFLDEADLFAPQKDAKGPKAACLGAWQNIVRRGRSRGIGCTMLTQRTAVLNKDLLTQADPLIIHRLTAPQDLAAIEAYLDVHGVDRETVQSILANVAKLPTGGAYVISPGTLGIKPTFVPVSRRKSFDSSATPEAGKASAKPRDLEAIDLGALSKKFADTIERAKADDPKALRAEVAKLRAELAKKPAPAVDEATIKRAVATERSIWVGEKRTLEQKLVRAGKILRQIRGLAEDHFCSIEPSNSPPPEQATQKSVTKPVTVSPNAAPKNGHQKGNRKPAEGVTPRQQRFLNAAATLTMLDAEVTRETVCAWVGVHPRGGSVGEELGALTELGLIEMDRGRLKPWRTAAECIDWALPCPSIFDRKKELVENSMRRIAFGVKRFVLENPSPFIVGLAHGDFKDGTGGKRVRPIDEPLGVVQPQGSDQALVTPYLVQLGQTGGGGSYSNMATVPLSTILSKNQHMLLVPTLIQTGYGEREGQRPRFLDINDPLGTIVSGGKHALVAAFLAKHYGGNETPGSRCNAPADTITAKDHNTLVEVCLAKQVGSIDTPFPTITSIPNQNQLVAANLVRIGHGEKQWNSVNEPLTTVTAQGRKLALVYSFLVRYFGTAIGQHVTEPLYTITGKDRFGLVLVVIDGITFAITDIGMRMLTPRELALCQGFDADYILTHPSWPKSARTKSAQVARIGNSVCPPLAEVLVRANLCLEPVGAAL